MANEAQVLLAAGAIGVIILMSRKGSASSGGDTGFKDTLEEKERRRQEVIDQMVEAGATESEATRVQARSSFRDEVWAAYPDVTGSLPGVHHSSQGDTYRLYAEIIEAVEDHPALVYSPSTGQVTIRDFPFVDDWESLREWNTVLPPLVTPDSSTQVFLVATRGLEDIREVM